MGHTWLCTQESLLVVFGVPYGLLGMKPGSAMYKANTTHFTVTPTPKDGFLIEHTQPSSLLEYLSKEVLIEYIEVSSVEINKQASKIHVLSRTQT